MSEYKNIYILKLLHIINYRLSVDGLIDLGLEYSQIAELFSEVVESGLVEENGEEGMKLTAKGQALLLELNKGLYPKNSREWILPSEENRIPKIDMFDIYLPKRKT